MVICHSGILHEDTSEEELCQNVYKHKDPSGERVFRELALLALEKLFQSQFELALKEPSRQSTLSKQSCESA